MLHTCLVNVNTKFGSPHILSDNGSKFKNKLFAQVAPALGVKQVFSSLIILEVMGALKIYIIFYRYVYGDMHIQNLNGMKWLI